MRSSHNVPGKKTAGSDICTVVWSKRGEFEYDLTNSLLIKVKIVFCDSPKHFICPAGTDLVSSTWAERSPLATRHHTLPGVDFRNYVATNPGKNCDSLF